MQAFLDVEISSRSATSLKSINRCPAFTFLSNDGESRTIQIRVFGMTLGENIMAPQDPCESIRECGGHHSSRFSLLQLKICARVVDMISRTIIDGLLGSFFQWTA
jgi:hypothetical protein